MNAIVIDGTTIRTQILERVEKDLARLQRSGADLPGLAVVRVGYDAASSAYLRQKKITAQSLGFNYHEHLLDSSAREWEVIELIRQLNADPAVHGILLQLPLPPHLQEQPIMAAIAAEKDIDGLRAVHAGDSYADMNGYAPCAPAAVMRILEEIGFDPAGKHAVVVGRSQLVGKSAAMMLLAADATVTICHSRSDVAAAVKHADLVVAALGVPRFIQGAWIKRGAVVIDVGINRVEGVLVGDVEFDEARRRAAYISPVPGGVGAVTVAMLMQNTLRAWSESFSANARCTPEKPAHPSWPIPPWPIMQPPSPVTAEPAPAI